MFTNKMIWQIDEYMLYCQSKQLSERQWRAMSRHFICLKDGVEKKC